MSDDLQPPAQGEQPKSAWGDLISEERKRELKGYLDRWEERADHGERKSPFDGVRLKGSDVYWLAQQKRDARNMVPDLHIEGAELDWTHLEGADLREAGLSGVRFGYARLENADLRWAHLEGGDLVAVRMEGADVSFARLEGAILSKARLDGAKFGGAHLERADLSEAYLEGADLREARLNDATLVSTHAEGADLSKARLERANLIGATVDGKTRLNEATLDKITRLGDIQWGGVGVVNLTQIDWSKITRLGDEPDVHRWSRAKDHEAVVRAYRQVGAQLRAQGMSEVADRFAYLAQKRQRKALGRRYRIPQWLGSWVLFMLAGYGYRPGRAILWYLFTIAAFAVAFFFLGPNSGHTFQWDGALVFSVTSFHGRGFFPGGLDLENWITRLAALEAVLGLLIEVSFIATFTQRFFGAK